MKVLFIGYFRFFRKAIVRRLKQAGYEVIGTARNSKSDAGMVLETCPKKPLGHYGVLKKLPKISVYKYSR